MTAPTVSSVTPATGPPGTKVKVNGTGLSQVTALRLGGTSAAFSAASDSALSFTVPASLGNGVDDLDLDYPGQVVAPGAFTVTGHQQGSTFNVMDYGADPSGKTLSSVAFNKARLAAIAYGKGGTIYVPSPTSQGFPGGHYLLDNSAANTPGCIHLSAPGIAIMGDGDDETTGSKLLLATAKIGPNGRRTGMIGIPAGSDGCAVGGLFVDGQSSPGNNTYPQIHNNPDPEILNVSSNHNRVSSFSGRSGTGFCVRFVGASPCYDFTVGDNQYAGGTLEGLSYGGGFITLDVDCQGLFGPSLWTYIRNVTIYGQMAVYNDAYVETDGLTMYPNKYNPACASCVEITTTGKAGVGSEAHDLTFSNIKSYAGKIKVEYYSGAPPIKNLILPSGQYWASTCP